MSKTEKLQKIRNALTLALDSLTTAGYLYEEVNKNDAWWDTAYNDASAAVEKLKSVLKDRFPD